MFNLRLYIVVFFIFIFGLNSVNANDEDIETHFIENMAYMLNHIADKNYLNEDKKFILYQKVLFLYKSIIASQSEEVFVNYVVNDFFNLSLCIPYLLKSDSYTLIEEMYHLFEKIESEENIVKYNKIHDIIYSDEIANIAKDYISDNINDVNEICYSHESFSSPDDIANF